MEIESEKNKKKAELKKIPLIEECKIERLEEKKIKVIFGATRNYNFDLED